MTPLLGYAPDLDPTKPGVLTNCSSLIPSLRGMEGAPSPQATSLPALSTACRNAAVVRKLDNTTRLIAGTATKLQEASTSSWTDVTRASGGDYGLGTELTWTFAQYSDQTLAAAKSDILQVSSSGAFANATANAPKASIVETANSFILLFDVNDQGAVFDSADRPHGWWAARTSGTWTPSVANEAYTGSLTSTPGPIKAGKRFGQAVIAYKDRSMYVGQYVGQSGWEFSLIPGEAGAVSQGVVVDVGADDNPKHIFMGFDDFYQYDGSKPVSIGNPLSRTVFGEINKSFSYVSKALHDRVNKRIYFFYPVASSTTTDKCVVYNYQTGMWGRDDRSIEAVVEFINNNNTYDNIATRYASYDAIPSIAYDSPFWTAGFPTPAIFNTSHLIQTMDGASSSSSLTTWDMGSDALISLVSRVHPLFLTKPATGSLTNYYRSALGDSTTTGQTVSMDSKGRFDFLRSANWHRCLIEMTGDVEISSIRVEAQEDGNE
jgi:hypothetical protein